MRIFILIIWTTFCSLGQGNPIKISYQSDLKDYESLSGKLDKYKIFFDGESHNVSSNETRHFNLFKFLYFNNGVRYFIKEYDFQWGYSVNKFIQTGDLDWIKSGIPSREAGEFYNQLYEFNKSLPPNDKIFFISIDAYGFRNTQDFLNKLTSDKGEQPASIKNVIDILRTIKKTHSTGLGMDIRGKDKNDILTKLKTVRQLVQKDQNAFMEYFGIDYIFFHLLVFNKASERRSDSNLAANFIEFSKFYKKGNYYLHYGNLHCQLKSNWLAGQISKTPEFRDQVCSFTSQYRDSEFWFYETRSQTDFGIINSGGYNKQVIVRMVNESSADCTLFPSKYLGQGIEKGTNFIFLLRNQKAMESYYKKGE